MHDPSQLPVGLHGRAFTVTDARASGLSRGRLRSSDLHRPFHGVRTADPDPSLHLRAEALLALVGPEALLSHLTAAGSGRSTSLPPPRTSRCTSASAGRPALPGTGTSSATPSPIPTSAASCAAGSP